MMTLRAVHLQGMRPPPPPPPPDTLEEVERCKLDSSATWGPLHKAGVHTHTKKKPLHMLEQS